MEIPTVPKELTVEWLTAALRNNAVINQASVKSFALAALDANQGMTGQLLRVTLTYDSEEKHAPRSLIAKFPTTDLQALEFTFTWTYSYEREVRFYERIASRTALRTPRCYFSYLDVDARKFLLLLEDLAPANSANSELGCSAQEAEAAILAIANLHAAFWEKPELVEMASWLPQWDMKQFQDMQVMYQENWGLFVKKMGGRLTQEMAATGEKMAQHITSVMDYNRQVPHTLIHGDYQLDNIFFTPANIAGSVIIIDWQLVSIGRGVYDVATILGGNMASANRAAVELQQINIYHQFLVDNGVRNYTLEQCLLDYRSSLLDILAQYIVVVCVITLTPAMEHKLLDVLIPRYFAAVLDTNAAEVLPLL